MKAEQGADDAGVAGDTPAPRRRADDLLPLAISQPDEAAASAFAILDGRPDHRERSLAHHAIAIVERDRGRTDVALHHARSAVRAARRAGPDREAEVRATFGTILLFAGRTSTGLSQLERALALSTGDARHRVLHLRGCTFGLLGRYDDAVRDLTAAADLSHRAGDKLWEGRALGSRGDVRRAMGDSTGSGADYASAEAVHLEIGAVLEATMSARNRALVALQQGDVVVALTLMEQAEERYRLAGVDPVEQLVDHAEALLTARLASEAEAMIDAALARDDLAPVWRGDLLLASSRAAMLQEEWESAEERARAAEATFRAHRRHRWAARSNLLAIEAAYAAEQHARESAAGVSALPRPSLPDLLTRTRALVRTLRRLDDPAVPEALLLLAQLAGDTGHLRMRSKALHEAAARRHDGAPLPRAAAWLARAMLAEQVGDRRALRHACRRGLDAVDEHRSLIGDLELRALATGYGLELVSIAIDDAERAHDARAVLWWADRWRATSLTSGSARPPDDEVLATQVSALRDVTRRLAIQGEEAHLVRERSRLESSVRHRYRNLRAESAESAGPDLGRLGELLGETTLVYIVVVRGVLHTITVADGRARLRRLGDLTSAEREASYARFALRRAAHGRVVDVELTGRQLQQALLGDPDPAWSRPSVLISPAAGLLTVPFGLMPVFRDSTFVVTPSLALWARSREARPSNASWGHADRGGDRSADRSHEGPGDDGHVALVTGPGLSTEQREVTELRRLHAEATVLGGDEATVDRTLEVLEGAHLAHLAAHGDFRADAPLFSSLMLADGPLMVHDLDRLRRPPRSVVLSACDSGGVHPIGADEALGLVSSLLAIGTRSVVASVNPVNDVATARVMKDVHEAVASGCSLAEGLRAARVASAEHPLLAATAASFTVWGS
ncbi:CHAT domain-containing protein [Terrabacter sp. 2RAF25]|uniref:CHAT domain-containing protein n=1 Tax=Terrabacter sp. 2RAF25 TaxID=3232998 RepID=UPI003F9C6B60